MGHDKFGRVLMMGDKVRILLRCRCFQPSSKVYVVKGVQDSFFADSPLYLLSNGKHYYNFDLIKEEKISCP